MVEMIYANWHKCCGVKYCYTDPHDKMKYCANKHIELCTCTIYNEQRKSVIHPLCSCLYLPIQEIYDPSFMFMFILTNTGNLWSILYAHVYTYQYRKSVIHPLCSCLHLPIQEICDPFFMFMFTLLHLPIQEIYDPSFMFMFTLTNTGNLCSILYVHVYTYQYRKSVIHPLCSCWTEHNFPVSDS
jgi:hypothetical protein